MNDTLFLLLFLAGYIVVMKFILPKLGIPT
jgi:hypothetical protein